MGANPDMANDREGSSELRVWVVRAGNRGQRVQYNLDNGVVTIMWDEWDAPDLSRFEGRRAYGEYIEQAFQELSPGQRGSSRDQVWRFYHEIRVGDLVVLPLKNHGTDADWIAIGKITGKAKYDPTLREGAWHHRSVRWPASTVPKTAAEKSLRNSIVKTNRTVFGPRSPQAPQRIFDLAKKFYDAEPPSGPEERPGPDAHELSNLSGDEAGVFGEDGNYVEGAEEMVAVLAYERSPEARQKCFDFHGTRCKVCDVDFGEEYGEFADGYIHVHHIVPLARAAKDGEYEVDPIDDLVPVCPNCHAMLHRHRDKPCTVETLKGIREARRQTDDR